jgi:hypothetical protein
MRDHVVISKASRISNYKLISYAYGELRNPIHVPSQKIKLIPVTVCCFSGK